LVEALRSEHSVWAVSPRGARVALSEKILAGIQAEVLAMYKFIKIVLSAIPSESGAIVGTTAAKRRMFMHSRATKQQAVHAQAIRSLSSLADRLSRFSECVGLLEVAAEQGVNVSVSPLPHTLDDLVTSRSALTQICEACLVGDPSPRTVEKMKTVCPTILCTVSPSVIPLSPESIASIVRCAGRQTILLIESVRLLAKSNPQVEKTLMEIAPVLRQAADGAEREAVLSALMEGLQERLIGETVVSTILNWASTNLVEDDNKFLFEFCFESGYIDHIAANANGEYLERFLSPRLVLKSDYARVYAALMAHRGNPAMAADVLETVIKSAHGFSFEDRFDLLTYAYELSKTSKRYRSICLGKYVQEPLIARGVCHEDHLLGVSELFTIAHSSNAWDIVLRCYMFTTAKESELVEAWTRAIFSNDAKQLLLETHAVAVEVGSVAVWKRIETTIALAEYTSVSSGWNVAEEFLIGTMNTSVLNVVEMYVKIVRELNVWIQKVPRTGEFGTLASSETMLHHLIDVVVDLIEKHPSDKGKSRLVSLLVLLRNAAPDHDRLIALIQQHTNESSAEKASLTAE
jgi:hypothetical protein